MPETHRHLAGEMILKAKDALNKDGEFMVMIPDGDTELQNAATRLGYQPTQDREYDASQSVLVEPVATDPAYRKMGLGKSAVLEAIRRCGLLGAKRAFVGSPQQFYYSIGFRPYATSTFWSKKMT